MKRCSDCGQTKPLDAYTARNKDKIKERRMSKQAPTALTLSSGWVESNIGSISVRIARREFLSNPPALQEARRERVRRLLLAEAKRQQKSHSYLWQHAREIYGI